VGIALILVGLYVVPIPNQSFSLNEATTGDAVPCWGIEISRGPVTFHWTTAKPAFFHAVSCAGNSLDYAVSNGSSGSDSFVSDGGFYEFGSACGTPVGPCYPANVTGTHTGPLLPALGMRGPPFP
jgi:hypothetical protein